MGDPRGARYKDRVRFACVGLASVVHLSLAPAALAGPVDGEASSSAARPQAQDPRRTEIGVLPAINFDSDLGFGFGVLAAIAKFAPDKNPYDWRVQVLLFATARDRGSGLELPYHADYVQFDFPGLLDPRLRLTGQVAFNKFSNAGYYGFGSKSRLVPVPEDPTEAEVRFHTYDRLYPSLAANLRYQLIDRPVDVGKWRLEVFGGTRLTYNDFTYYEDSLLAQHRALAETDTPDGRTLADLLEGTEDHVLWILNLGLLWDTRDQEFVPTRGTFTELSFRASPGIEQDLTFAGVTLSTAWFASVHEDILVAATRAVVDLQAGAVPFYEQASFGAFAPAFGPGGGRSVRGVPLQRFAGKLKALLNLELRARLLPFEVFGQKINLGLIGFADTGRVWADFETFTLGGAPIDGPFSDFALGLGGGLRAQWGETFIIRGDFGYAPTEGTTGLYIDVGHIF
jgi:outer membrane protein assembly factor BamA